MSEILWCDHASETSSAVLAHGNIYLVCISKFWVCDWNPMVSPFNEISLPVLSQGAICFC